MVERDEAAEARRREPEGAWALRDERAAEGADDLYDGRDEARAARDPFGRLKAAYGDLIGSERPDAVALFQYGRQFLQLAMYDEAADAFSRTLAVTPNWADAQYYYASALRHAGRLEEARHEYGKARELDPTMIEARFEDELLKLKMSKKPALEGDV